VRGEDEKKARKERMYRQKGGLTGGGGGYLATGVRGKRKKDFAYWGDREYLGIVLAFSTSWHEIWVRKVT